MTTWAGIFLNSSTMEGSRWRILHSVHPRPRKALNPESTADGTTLDLEHSEPLQDVESNLR